MSLLPHDCHCSGCPGNPDSSLSAMTAIVLPPKPILAAIHFVPQGPKQGESFSRPLAPAFQLIKQSGLDYRVGPMSTVIEGDWEKVMWLIRRCHDEFLDNGSTRVLSTIQIDDRPGTPKGRIRSKVDSLEKAVGMKLKK